MSERIHQNGNSASGTFLAVTIGVGPVWRVMAELAAESVRRRTGLETRILGEEAMARCRMSSPHFLKMRLFEEFPEAEHILYFDADMIFLQQWDPRVFAGRGEFICVRDRADDGNVQGEAQLAELPEDMYFNSGLFLANRTHHAAMLHTQLACLCDLLLPISALRRKLRSVEVGQNRCARVSSCPPTCPTQP